LFGDGIVEDIQRGSSKKRQFKMLLEISKNIEKYFKRVIK